MPTLTLVTFDNNAVGVIISINYNGCDFVHEECELMCESKQRLTFFITTIQISRGHTQEYICIQVKAKKYENQETDEIEKLFDVYVSYHDSDEVWALKLIKRLEASGYSVCFERKHFPSNRELTTSTGRAIDRNKKNLCILSRHYIEDNWCEMILHDAASGYIKRLIPLFLGDFTLRELPPECVSIKLFDSINTSSYVYDYYDYLLKLLLKDKLGGQPGDTVLFDMDEQ